jgi:tetratricopeptide (TPR) repeat protein
MKKTIIALLGILLFATTTNVSIAKTSTKSPATAAAIKLYKAGDYTQSYTKFSDIVKKDPSNALAYYYLGMSSVQLGKKEEAMVNYNKASSLSPNGVLGSYARRGIRCLDDPAACHSNYVEEEKDLTVEDKFIKGKFGSGFSNKARGAYELQKIEHMKREINRQEDMSPQKFREYKDFSSQAPSDEEIASAIRTLQYAGMNVFPDNNYSDISLMLGTQNNSNSYNILNTMLGSNRAGGSNIDPQIIQALLTTQMTASF